MSKANDMLKMMQEHLGEWCCAVCASNSNQPAAIFRELKKRGYNFEEPSTNRWANELLCDKCGVKRTHYKLLSKDPIFVEKERFGFDDKTRKKILEIFDNRDAFTGARITSVAEVDHKTPWTRLDQDFNTSNASNEDLINTFQLLTREHNLLKDRMCAKCKSTKKRPPFLEIEFWYEGNQNYEGSCVGCGWYDGIVWRQKISNKIKNI